MLGVRSARVRVRREVARVRSGGFGYCEFVLVMVVPLVLVLGTGRRVLVDAGDELSGLRGEAGGEALVLVLLVALLCECECWLRVLETEMEGRRRETFDGRRACMSIGGIAAASWSPMSNALSSSSSNSSSISNIWRRPDGYF